MSQVLLLSLPAPCLDLPVRALEAYSGPPSGFVSNKLFYFNFLWSFVEPWFIIQHHGTILNSHSFNKVTTKANTSFVLDFNFWAFSMSIPNFYPCTINLCLQWAHKGRPGKSEETVYHKRYLGNDIRNLYLVVTLGTFM